MWVGSHWGILGVGSDPLGVGRIPLGVGSDPLGVVRIPLGSDQTGPTAVLQAPRFQRRGWPELHGRRAPTLARAQQSP